MNEFLVLIVGVGLGCFLMLYLLNTLDDDKHYILKLLLMFFVVSTLLLIPKAGIDSMRVCETVVSNSTDMGAGVFHYEYESFCYQRDEGTAKSFLENTQRMYYLIIGYSIVFMAVWGMMKLYDSVKRRRQG